MVAMDNVQVLNTSGCHIWLEYSVPNWAWQKLSFTQRVGQPRNRKYHQETLEY
jgi:hypothetical protein